MFDPKKFTTTQNKPFPVILLLDVSSSMNIVIDPENTTETGEIGNEDGQEVFYVEGRTTKLQLLNDAVETMIENLKEEEKMETEFWVSTIVFGNDAHLHLSLTKSSNVIFEKLTAEGDTALGAALKLAKNQIEDKNIIPSRAYRPVVVLVTDGKPNDDWQSAMREFVFEGRSSKCFCIAMGIGEDADQNVLRKFIENTPYLTQDGDIKTPNTVFYSDDADSLHDFFQKVTMTVISKSKTGNLNSHVSKPSSSDETRGYW